MATTIRGISYSEGDAFYTYASGYGSSSPDGTKGATDYVAKGVKLYFVSYTAGAAYPYGVTTNSEYVESGTLTSYYTQDIFPPKELTITYDANGGDNTPDPQTAYYNVPVRLSSDITRTGYTFLGWASTKNATSPTFYVKNTYSFTANMYLYAVWELIEYTITYDANGGEDAPGAQTAAYGESVELSDIEPARTGYKFLGWSTTADGGVEYSAGDSYKAAADVTLYAVWEPIAYTVIFDANGGTCGESSREINYGSTVGTLPEASKQYYTFLGWFTAAEGGTQITEDTIIMEDVTFYAQYEADATIHVHDGSGFKPGIPYIYTDGGWKKGYAYVHDGTGWKQGVG